MADSGHLYRAMTAATAPTEQERLGSRPVGLARDRRVLLSRDEPARRDQRAVRDDVRVPEVHIATDHRMPAVSAAILDTDDVLKAEMLGPKLPAERPARGLDRIADACDQGNAERVPA